MPQALQYKTPDEVYASASGGGALIVDKFHQRRNRFTSQNRGSPV